MSAFSSGSVIDVMFWKTWLLASCLHLISSGLASQGWTGSAADSKLSRHSGAAAELA